jgi:hypothetical protein
MKHLELDDVRVAEQRVIQDLGLSVLIDGPSLQELRGGRKGTITLFVRFACMQIAPCMHARIESDDADRCLSMAWHREIARALIAVSSPELCLASCTKPKEPWPSVWIFT